MVPQDLEIYRQLVENSLDAQYVLDREKMEFVLVNPAFESLTGYSASEVLHGKLAPLDLVYPEDWDVIEILDDPKVRIHSHRFQFRLVRKDGQIRQVENYIRHIRFRGHPYRIGSMRDITARVRFEELLTKEIHTEKDRVTAVAKANVRITQLNERIQKVPLLTARLLKYSSEEELLAEAAELMCDRFGLNYRDVTFLLREGDYLVVKHTTRPLSKKRYHLERSSRYAKAFRQDSSTLKLSKDECILPIQSKERDLGLMHVRFHRDEVLLFDEQQFVRSVQRDILRTIGNILGLVIDNMRLMAKIREQSIFDGLTKTYNRNFFNQKIQEEFRRAVRYRRDLSLMIVDVDKFKHFNDTYGHLQGDAILKEVAEILRGQLREQDIICRYGGDEFVILLPETPLVGAVTKAERLRASVEKRKFPNLLHPGRSIQLSLSIGVAALTARMQSAKELFHCADEALYEAKKKGRNQVCSYRS